MMFCACLKWLLHTWSIFPPLPYHIIKGFVSYKVISKEIWITSIVFNNTCSSILKQYNIQFQLIYCKIHIGTVLGTFCLIIKKKWVKFYDKQLLYSKHISFETSLSNAKDSYCLLLKKCFIRDFYPDRCITEKTFQTSSCMHWTSLPLLYPQPCLRRWPWGLCSLSGDSRTTRSTVSVPAVSMCVEESMLSALIR